MYQPAAAPRMNIIDVAAAKTAREVRIAGLVDEVMAVLPDNADDPMLPASVCMTALLRRCASKGPAVRTALAGILRKTAMMFDGEPTPAAPAAEAANVS